MLICGGNIARRADRTGVGDAVGGAGTRNRQGTRADCPRSGQRRDVGDCTGGHIQVASYGGVAGRCQGRTVDGPRRRQRRHVGDCASRHIEVATNRDVTGGAYCRDIGDGTRRHVEVAADGDVASGAYSRDVGDGTRRHVEVAADGDVASGGDCPASNRGRRCAGCNSHCAIGCSRGSTSARIGATILRDELAGRIRADGIVCGESTDNHLSMADRHD